METKEDTKQQTGIATKKMPTSLNVLIWVIVGTIIFLVFWFIIKPEMARQETTAWHEAEKKCYKIQGLDLPPNKYKCLVTYPYSEVCKIRDTTVNPQYTAFAYCMGQNGYKEY